MVEAMGVGIAGGRLASRPYQMYPSHHPNHRHPFERLRAGSNLSPSRRPLRNSSISPTTTPITLTLILSQDGRGDKRDGYNGYAKVSVKGEGIREGRATTRVAPTRDEVSESWGGEWGGG